MVPRIWNPLCCPSSAGCSQLRSKDKYWGSGRWEQNERKELPIITNTRSGVHAFSFTNPRYLPIWNTDPLHSAHLVLQWSWSPYLKATTIHYFPFTYKILRCHGFTQLHHSKTKCTRKVKLQVTPKVSLTLKASLHGFYQKLSLSVGLDNLPDKSTPLHLKILTSYIT